MVTRGDENLHHYFNYLHLLLANCIHAICPQSHNHIHNLTLVSRLPCRTRLNETLFACVSSSLGNLQTTLLH